MGDPQTNPHSGRTTGSLLAAVMLAMLLIRSFRPDGTEETGKSAKGSRPESAIKTDAASSPGRKFFDRPRPEPQFQLPQRQPPYGTLTPERAEALYRIGRFYVAPDTSLAPWRKEPYTEEEVVGYYPFLVQNGEIDHANAQAIRDLMNQILATFEARRGQTNREATSALDMQRSDLRDDLLNRVKELQFPELQGYDGKVVVPKPVLVEIDPRFQQMGPMDLPRLLHMVAMAQTLRERTGDLERTQRMISTNTLLRRYGITLTSAQMDALLDKPLNDLAERVSPDARRN